MSDAEAAAPSQEMTIDEIAQHAGLPVSTVRMYQNKGLLAPPTKRGRVGYYGAPHQDRLRLIAHLQTRGFSLAAIKELLESWNAGQSLDRLLGVSLVAPSLARSPIRMTPAELVARFDGVGISQAEIQRAGELGLLTIDGAEVVVEHEAFIDAGAAVAKLGVPVSEVLDEYEALGSAVDEIADRFRSVFERHMWQPFVDGEVNAAHIADLRDRVQQLTDLATSVVTVELHDRFATFAAEYIERVSQTS